MTKDNTCKWHAYGMRICGGALGGHSQGALRTAAGREVQPG